MPRKEHQRYYHFGSPNNSRNWIRSIYTPLSLIADRQMIAFSIDLLFRLMHFSNKIDKILPITLDIYWCTAWPSLLELLLVSISNTRCRIGQFVQRTCLMPSHRGTCHCQICCTFPVALPFQVPQNEEHSLIQSVAN